MNILEAKNFIYIENFAVILINSKKVNLENDSNTSNKENVEPKKLKSSNSKITSFFKVQPKKDLIQNETNSSLKNKNELTNGKSTIKKSDKVEEEDFHNLSNYDPISLFENQESDFFYKSKKVLLMFRRV